MEMAAVVGTELALSGLFRVVSILNKNFRDVITTEEMKPLNDFVNCQIEVLAREAKSDDLVQLMSSLTELQAAALKMEDLLDLYEYDQIEKQVNSSSSEHIPKEKVLPPHLRDGLNKLLMIAERVQNKRRSITTSNSFIDFLVGESHVERPVIKLAISDISRVIKMLGSNFESLVDFREILEQLKDVVSYHIQALVGNVNFDDLAQSMLQAASLQLDLFDPDEYDNIGEYDTLEQVSSSNYISLKKEELGPILSKSPLRIGLEKLLKFVEQMEKKHPSITSKTCTTQPLANTITPTLRSGVEKWLKLVDQEEKEHPYITSMKGTTHQLANTITPISITFFPGRGFLSTMCLENDKCQENVKEIMQNHKNNLKKLIFGWTDAVSSIDTCKKFLERLKPGQNLENLSIIQYSCSEFPNWMKEKNWPHLQTLELRSCRSLKHVILPPSLRELDVYDCCELRLISLASETLRTVKLVGCPMLDPMCLSDLAFRRTNNLETLELRGLPKIHTLPNLSPTVTKLLIEDCPELTSLGNLQCCTSLKYLEISKCPKLMRKEASLVEGVVEGDIANHLPQVYSISIDEPLLVIKLVKQQAFLSTRVLSFGRLYRRYIDLFDEHFHQFSSLDDLTLQNCEALPNLEKLSSLKSLSIFECYNDISLPKLPISLQYIRISKCPILEKNYKEGGRLRNTVSHIPEVVIY